MIDVRLIRTDYEGVRAALALSDDALIRTSHWMPGEHDSGSLGRDQPLDDDADARLSLEAEQLPVHERRLAPARCPDVLDRLHDRLRYTREPDNSWRIERLSP